jgi:hypothetical protein
MQKKDAAGGRRQPASSAIEGVRDAAARRRILVTVGGCFVGLAAAHVDLWRGRWGRDRNARAACGLLFQAVDAYQLADLGRRASSCSRYMQAVHSAMSGKAGVE